MSQRISLPTSSPSANRLSRSEFFFSIFYLILVFIYFELRAFTGLITQDESGALSYRFIPLSDLFLYLGDACTANHHLLTSLFVRLIAPFSGLNELLFRQLSVLSFLLYGIALLRFQSYLPSRSARVCALICLTFNIFTVEYFGIARGYALSIALLVLSLWLGTEITSAWQRRIKPHRYILILHGVLILAALSNFSAAIFVIAILFALNAQLLYLHLRSDISLRLALVNYLREGMVWCSAAAAIFFVAYLIPAALRVKGCDPGIPQELYFWRGTVTSLIRDQVKWIGLEGFGIVAKTAIFAHIPFLLFIILFSPKARCAAQIGLRNVQKTISLVLVAVYICLNVAALVGVPFPSNRAAIYLVPFYILLTFFTVTSMPPSPLRSVFKIYSAALLILAVSNATLASKLNGCAGYFCHDREVKELVHILNLEAPPAALKIKISCTSIMTLAYYLEKHNVKHVEAYGVCGQVSLDDISKYDYLYLDSYNANEQGRFRIDPRLRVVRSWSTPSTLYQIVQ